MVPLVTVTVTVDEDLSIDVTDNGREIETGVTEGALANLAGIVAALDRLFARKEGQALVRLLADAVAGAIPSLATATQDWCDDIRAVIVLRLRADEPGTDLDIADAAARFLAPEFDALAEELFTAALGRGLLHLPKFALPEVAEER